MRFFSYNEERNDTIFFKQPMQFSKLTPREDLAYCLGGALYMPATRRGLAQEVLMKKHPYLTSMIIDLEDAVGDEELEEAFHILVENMRAFQAFMDDGVLTIEDLPLIFVRVRNPEQLAEVIKTLGEAQNALTGYVFPKFGQANGKAFFEQIVQQNELGYTLYGMPILESDDVIFKERRFESLLAIREILITYYDYVLNVRIGTTDFCGLFGIRRRVDSTIYDVTIVRDCIADIINILNRTEHRFVISGPVWEYFTNKTRIFRTALRETPFMMRYGQVGLEAREQLINEYVDGLMREVFLDQINGLVGKTIIHPTHILPVNAMYVVTHEEYMDAENILQNSDGQIGVQKSMYNNKMNEMKPHFHWAERVMHRARTYGVYNPNEDFRSLLLEEAIRHDKVLDS
ncbi:MAG: HpcH/HpaI aldolase/citrate lyase family protein [Caryophanon sp.]|nr:HpcH/HpaI aldolase/citrate lyase family protein [Caryophanon sp.]